MLFVERIRRYAKESPLQEAIERAIDECIEEGILAEFLSREKVKGIGMSILYEFDQELHDKTLYQDGQEEGRKEGRKEGKDLYLIALVARMYKKWKSPEVIANELEEDLPKIIKICDAIREYEKLGRECDAEQIFKRVQV